MLFVVDQNGNTLETFLINEVTGRLTLIDVLESNNSPTFIGFLWICNVEWNTINIIVAEQPSSNPSGSKITQQLLWFQFLWYIPLDNQTYYSVVNFLIGLITIFHPTFPITHIYWVNIRQSCQNISKIIIEWLSEFWTIQRVTEPILSEMVTITQKSFNESEGCKR